MSFSDQHQQHQQGHEGVVWGTQAVAGAIGTDTLHVHQQQMADASAAQIMANAAALLVAEAQVGYHQQMADAAALLVADSQATETAGHHQMADAAALLVAAEAQAEDNATVTETAVGNQRFNTAHGIVINLDAPVSEDDELVPPSNIPIAQQSLQTYDVLYGRGGATNLWHGNVRYRDLVSACKSDYANAAKRDKKGIARKIIRAIRSANPPGRFLKKRADGNWYDVGDKEATAKCSQSLREHSAEEKKRKAEERKARRAQEQQAQAQAQELSGTSEETEASDPPSATSSDIAPSPGGTLAAAAAAAAGITGDDTAPSINASMQFQQQHHLQQQQHGLLASPLLAHHGISHGAYAHGMMMLHPGAAAGAAAAAAGSLPVNIPQQMADSAVRNQYVHAAFDIGGGLSQGNNPATLMAQNDDNRKRSAVEEGTSDESERPSKQPAREPEGYEGYSQYALI